MRSRWVGKYGIRQTGIRFLTGLGLLCCGLLFPAPFAKGLPIGGITAATTITLVGNNTIDSFDSSDPSSSLWHSNWWYQGHNFGTYTNIRRTDQVTVGTDASILVINGGISIYGYVDTAPGGTENLNGNGDSVGDLAWIGPNPQSPLNTGIQSGHLQNNMNVVFNDVVGPTPTNSLYNSTTGYPNGKWLDPYFISSGTNIGGNTYYYMLTNFPGLTTSPSNQVFYTLDVNGLSFNKNKASIFIGASNCVFLMTNGLALRNGDNLTLNVTNNANVAIYTGGTFDVGNGSVNDVYQYAPTFKIFGLPTCASIVFPANATCVAWIYAPEADVSFNGGGSNPFDIVGAFMVHSVALKGGMNFHFDQVLRTNTPNPPSAHLLPVTKGAQLGTNAAFTAIAGGDSPLYCQWFLNQTNPVAADTNLNVLSLTNVQFTDAGSYSVLITNIYGSVTSAPASLIVYSNATPTLTIDSGSTNGQFQFDILGVTGLNYSVQASSNLVDWAPLTTNVSPFTFVDTNSTTFPVRFYRSVFTP
jgi:hypothetical protein